MQKQKQIKVIGLEPEQEPIVKYIDENDECFHGRRILSYHIAKYESKRDIYLLTENSIWFDAGTPLRSNYYFTIFSYTENILREMKKASGTIVVWDKNSTSNNPHFNICIGWSSLTCQDIEFLFNLISKIHPKNPDSSVG